jgi:hypothetical protein
MCVPEITCYCERRLAISPGRTLAAGTALIELTLLMAVICEVSMQLAFQKSAKSDWLIEIRAHREITQDEGTDEAYVRPRGHELCHITAHAMIPHEIGISVDSPRSISWACSGS